MESNDNSVILKTPRRTRRSSMVTVNQPTTVEVAENEENIAPLKTPGRKRRTSLKDSEQEEALVAPSKTPKTRRRTSVLELQAPIEETLEVEGEDCRLDPVTPGRSARTPGRLAEVQTPRRSCRKSIKPIQEYESIVAYKGLSLSAIKVKRNLVEETSKSTSGEKEEEETPLQTNEAPERENKWNVADIGRVSTKRSKKKRNNKRNRRLQRQAKVCDENDSASDEANEECEKETPGNHDLDQITSEKLEKQEQIMDVVTVSTEVTCSKDQTEEDIGAKTPTDQNKAQTTIQNEPEKQKVTEHEEKNSIANEKQNVIECENPNDNEPEKFNATDHEGKNSNEQEKQNVIVCDNPNATEPEKYNATELEGKHSNEQEKQNAIDCENPNVFEQDEEEEDDGDEGDIILNAMPITGDDCMQNEEQPRTCISSQSNEESNKSEDADCIMILSEEESIRSRKSDSPLKKEIVVDDGSPDSTRNSMPPLFVCSDDDDEEEEKNVIPSISKEEIRKIVLGVDDKPMNTKKQDEKEEEQVTLLDATFEMDDSPKSCPSSLTRIQTPFKTKPNNPPDIIVEPESDEEGIFNIIIEPAKYELKSSRKRSFSFCDVERPKKNVTFHSPSNITMKFHEGDLVKSAVKHTPTNITKRRKRSLSVTETERDLMDYIKGKKPTTPGTTPQKKAGFQSRIKMPNFSNIHQRQFQRMESISDHMARKAERAKILINSNTKIKPVSVQKVKSVNSVFGDGGSKIHVPKARQKIDMSGQENKIFNKTSVNTNFTGLKFRSKSKPDIHMIDDFAPLKSKTPTKASAVSTSLFKQNNTSKLPKPNFNFNVDSTNFKNLTSLEKKPVTPIAPRLPNPREYFNFGSNVRSIKKTVKNVEKPVVREATKIKKRVENLEDRRKRMMDMFKSKATQRIGENKREILKGVRTNRRFELQMKHRNHQNQME